MNPYRNIWGQKSFKEEMVLGSKGLIYEGKQLGAKTEAKHPERKQLGVVKWIW